MLSTGSNLREEEQVTLIQMRELLEKDYKIVECIDDDVKNILPQLKRFEILMGAEKLAIVDLFRIITNGKELFLVTLKVDSIVENVSRHGLVHEKNVRSLTSLIFADVKKDFGHILIRPETIGDKIIETFEKYELDFDEHPEFSYRYYVAAKDREKARKAISYKMMEAINQDKDFLVEIYQHNLVAKKTLYSFDTKSVAQLTKLVFSIFD